MKKNININTKFLNSDTNSEINRIINESESSLNLNNNHKDLTVSKDNDVSKFFYFDQDRLDESLLSLNDVGSVCIEKRSTVPPGYPDVEYALQLDMQPGEDNYTINFNFNDDVINKVMKHIPENTYDSEMDNKITDIMVFSFIFTLLTLSGTIFSWVNQWINGLTTLILSLSIISIVVSFAVLCVNRISSRLSNYEKHYRSFTLTGNFSNDEERNEVISLLRKVSSDGRRKSFFNNDNYEISKSAYIRLCWEDYFLKNNAILAPWVCSSQINKETGITTVQNYLYYQSYRHHNLVIKNLGNEKLHNICADAKFHDDSFYIKASKLENNDERAELLEEYSKNPEGDKYFFFKKNSYNDSGIFIEPHRDFTYDKKKEWYVDVNPSKNHDKDEVKEITRTEKSSHQSQAKNAMKISFVMRHIAKHSLRSDVDDTIRNELNSLCTTRTSDYVQKLKQINTFMNEDLLSDEDYGYVLHISQEFANSINTLEKMIRLNINPSLHDVQSVSEIADLTNKELDVVIQKYHDLLSNSLRENRVYLHSKMGSFNIENDV